MSVITTTRGPAHLPDEELLLNYHDERDSDARDELVRRFIPFARRLALRYVHSREPLDDLVQVACVGLLKALERFEPMRGKRFTTYAAPTILGELKRYFRDKGWSVHVPRDVQERALAVNRQSERLSAATGRAPTVDELADVLECTAEQVIEAIDAAHNYHPASLDAPITTDADGYCPLAETIGDEDGGFELADERQELAASWATLDETERQVVGLRLVGELTQREISQRIGCSQMHVSRLLRRSMIRLDAAVTPV
jgi:RNA polymerase sigma-B factor